MSRRTTWQRLAYRREAAEQRERVRLARAAFWLAGELAWVRVSQRVWRVVWDTEPGDPEPRFHTVPSGKMKISVLTNRLISLSMHSAWGHWDHFALDHSGCERAHEICPDRRCRGVICPREPAELDE